jgi:ribosomal protein S18 acetylase RimI-like enzyme
MDQSATHDVKASDLAGPREFLEQPVGQGTMVRRPSETDIAGLAAHFSEMQTYYNRPVSNEVALKAAKLACKPPVNAFDPRVLVALADDKIVGSVVMNVTFPASDLSQSLYIRDLYVAKAARRSGVGRMLVEAAMRLRAAEGFSALEWTTDSSNAVARRLYETCGARKMDRTYFNERRGVARSAAARSRNRESQVLESD